MGRGVFPGGNSWRPPLFTLGRFPIYVTGLILMLQVVGMLVVVATRGAILGGVMFTPEALLTGRVWTFVTYAFFEGPSIPFVIGAYFFYRFGSTVEHAMNRGAYVTLCACLLGIPPLVLMAAHFLKMSPSGLLGGQMPHLSIFMAFCAMYPNVPSFFGIRIKWFGLAFFAISILQWLSVGAWPMVFACGTALAFAIWFVRKLGFREGFSLSEELLGPGRKFPGLSKGSPRKKKAKVRKAKEVKPKLRPKSDLLKQDDSEVDRILDKINQEGLHSLTDEERDLLQRKAGN